jgi:uncharacterized protein YecT (DUF1311 family)
MLKRHRLLALTVLALAAAAVTAIASAQPRPRVTAAKLSPPVIHEIFTPLPCAGKPNARTTVEQEGCAEHEIVRTDKLIDAASASLFRRLPDDPARRRFLTGARAWFTYRNADCASFSDLFEGGSQAPVLAAQCDAGRNKTRLADLRRFLSDLPH